LKHSQIEFDLRNAALQASPHQLSVLAGTNHFQPQAKAHTFEIPLDMRIELQLGLSETLYIKDS